MASRHWGLSVPKIGGESDTSGPEGRLVLIAPPKEKEKQKMDRMRYEKKKKQKTG